MSTRTILRCTAASLAALFFSASAHALLFRAYLASDGNDANACTLAQPCRLLPAALAAVANGGEVWMLDSANYNTATVTVDKSVTILAIPGAVGSVVAGAGPAISIAAASLEVALRNLVVVPLPGATAIAGVHLTGASTLTIENSVIANLPGEGVWVFGAGTVKIVDTIIRSNGGRAVALQNGATASISGTQMLENSQGGVWAHGDIAANTTTASVADSAIFGAGGATAVRAYASIAGAAARIFLKRSTIEGANYGLAALTSGVGSALVTVSYSMVTGNGYGWHQSGVGSVIKSLGNNHIADNANVSIGSLTPTALQ